MSKKDIVERLQTLLMGRNIALNRKQCAAVFDSVFEVVKEEVATSEACNVPKFGKFSSR